MLVGTEYTTKVGRAVRVVGYKNAHAVEIEFEDGFRKEVESGNLKKGAVAHPDDSKVPVIGSRWKTQNYGWCTVVEYVHARNIIVEFDEPYKCRVRTENRSVRSGEIKNPLLPDERGFFFGQGEFSSKIKSYEIWGSIKDRLNNHDGKNPSYVGTTICEDWLNYQNFAKWYNSQIGVDQGDWHLDKDVLCKGNKIYSPDKCVLLPSTINVALTKREALRGASPIGVHHHKRDNKFYCQLTMYGKPHYVGSFLTSEECFNAYKTVKEAYLKELAEKWRDKIDPRAYEALLNYTVEITD